MALNAWQRIDRVIPGQPFGTGSDGALSSATIPTLTKDSCSGSGTTLTTSGSTFSNGDILLIHQTRGTGVGQWEINRVTGGGGTTSLTLQVALNYTYTDSGASQAQAIKIPQYTTVTVQSGTWTIPAWDGNVGGIFPFAAKISTTVTGTISGAGGQGDVNTSGSLTGGTGGGFRGGNTSFGNGQKFSGEGTSGASAAQSTANGNGGGGGNVSNNVVSGAGGGHVSAGGNSFGNASTGGGTGGAADLTNIIFGGGGGGGGRDITSTSQGAGNGGGGIVMAFSKTISISGGINVRGGSSKNSATNNSGEGGLGAGGSILVVCQTATLGSALALATGGSHGTNWTTPSGSGSDGRIAVHHQSTVTGTTNPTFTDVSDSTLVENFGGSFVFNLL